MTGDRSQLRSLKAPRLLTVRTGPSGEPVSVRLGKSVRNVEHLREVWRIDDEWWRAPLSRLYVEVVLDDGSNLTLFRDLIDGRWYTQ